MNIMVSDIQPCNTYSPEQCHSNAHTHVAQCTLPAFGFKNHQINTSSMKKGRLYGRADSGTILQTLLTGRISRPFFILLFVHLLNGFRKLVI